jgi:CheY-like chemotaxis protein
MRAALTGMGVVVSAIQDGREALRDIDRHQPDAMVLALTMPGFDGLAVLGGLAVLPRWRQVPVFIWTPMQLDATELAGLSQTAGAVLAYGGGATDQLLQGLRNGRKMKDPHL